MASFLQRLSDASSVNDLGLDEARSTFSDDWDSMLSDGNNALCRICHGRHAWLALLSFSKPSRDEGIFFFAAAERRSSVNDLGLDEARSTFSDDWDSMLSDGKHCAGSRPAALPTGALLLWRWGQPEDGGQPVDQLGGRRWPPGREHGRRGGVSHSWSTYTLLPAHQIYARQVTLVDQLGGRRRPAGRKHGRRRGVGSLWSRCILLIDFCARQVMPHSAGIHSLLKMLLTGHLHVLGTNSGDAESAACTAGTCCSPV